jgi:hypothetical protein
MNTLIWIAQVALATVFFVAGVTKIVAYKKLVKTLENRRNTLSIEVSPAQGRALGLLEIVGAIGVIMPPALTPDALVPDYLLVRIAAAGLALLMVAATIYHFRRKESAAPSVTVFLLALFVIVGRWPH